MLGFRTAFTLTSRLKPIGSQQIDWINSVTLGMTDCLLWSEGGGVPVNLATPRIITTLTGSPSWVVSPFGLAGYSTGGSSFNIPDHGNIVAADFTVRVLVRIVSWPANFTALFDKGTVTREIAVFFDTSGNLNYVEFGSSGGSVAFATAMTAGGTWDFVVSRTGSTVNFYVNGIFINTTNNGGAVAAAVPLSFGVNTSGGGVNADAQYITAQIWNRGLQRSEILQLYAAPYCFLQPVDNAIDALAAVTVQLYLRPDADSIDGSWTNELGGTALFSSIDESAANDTDYIQSSVNPSSDVAKISLSNPSTSVGQPVKLRYRYKRDSTRTANLTVRLLQGSTEIASWTHTDISTSFVTSEQTLTAPQFAAISDFDDLYIEFTANS